MDPLDDYIGKRLQNWAARARPPAYGKALLLRNAAQAAYFRSNQAGKTTPSIHHPIWRLLRTSANRKQRRDCPAQFIDWTIVYSFELSLVNLKLMF